jgi:hypothetical protein
MSGNSIPSLWSDERSQGRLSVVGSCFLSARRWTMGAVEAWLGNDCQRLLPAKGMYRVNTLEFVGARKIAGTEIGGRKW